MSIVTTAAVAMDVLQFARTVRRTFAAATDEEIAELWENTRSDFIEAIDRWNLAKREAGIPVNGPPLSPEDADADA